MKKTKLIALIIALFFAVSIMPGGDITGAFAQPANNAPQNGNTIIILHTNDFHGNLKPLKDKDIDPDKEVGGAAYLATVIKNIKKENPGRVLLLDAGDIAQGTPISNIFQGKPVIEAMNYDGYDAMTLGNHEFDWSLAALKNMISLAKFPIINANLVYSKPRGMHILGIKPYIIKRVGNINVGIIGLITPYTRKITKPSNIGNMIFCSPEKTAKKYIPEMISKGADIIIALNHNGFDDDIELAEKVSGIDIIVGGHSHTKNLTTKRVGNTLIVQAGCYGRYLGKLEVTFDPKSKKIVSFTDNRELIPIAHNGIEPDKNVQKIIDKYESKIKGKMSKVIGYASEDISRFAPKGQADSCVGSLVCDSLREASGADAVVYNSGGIRFDINKGKITLEDTFKILPFDNTLVTMNLSGADLLKNLEHGAAGRSSVQISGMTFTIDRSKPAGSRISDAIIAGKPLDLNKTYKVATVDFLFYGGDGFNFKAGKNAKFGDLSRTVFGEYISKRKTISSPQGARVKVINDNKD